MDSKTQDDEVNLQSTTEKTLEDNPTPPDSTENEFTTYYCERIKIFKERLRKKSIFSDIRNILFSVGLIQALLSALGIFYFFDQYPDSNSNENLGDALRRNMDIRDTLVSLMFGFLFGITLLVVSVQKHIRPLLTLWTWFVWFRTCMTILNLTSEIMFSLMGVRNFQPALNYAFILTSILLNIIVFCLSLFTLTSGINLTVPQYNNAAVSPTSS